MELKWFVRSTILAGAIMTSACGGQNDMDHSNMDHSNMDHSASGVVSKELEKSKNPMYPIGSQAIIEAEHMDGMKGAIATIKEAYDTYMYSVSYTPTTGGEKVENHKWVFHGEIKDAGNEPFQAGAEVILEADHLAGMKGATAVIDSVVKTTVYMVDYTPTTGGEVVKDHKWVIESELTSNK